MKKYTSFFLLMITFLFINSCSNKVNFEYSSRVKNVLYNDIRNEFYIKSEHPEKLKVEITNATIEQKNDTTFCIIPSNKNYSIMRMSDGKKIRKIKFIKRDIPKPQITFNGLSYYDSNEITVEEARKIGSFSSTLKYFEYALQFVSSSLEIMRIDTSNKVSYEKVGVNKKRRVYSLRRAEVGDSYVFHNIRLEVSKDLFIDGQDLVLRVIE